MRWAASFVSARALQSTRLAELVAEDAEGNAAAHAANASMLQIDTAVSAGMPHAAAFARRLTPASCSDALYTNQGEGSRLRADQEGGVD
jgi:hypothetical protein